MCKGCKCWQLSWHWVASVSITGTVSDTDPCRSRVVDEIVLKPALGLGRGVKEGCSVFSKDYWR